MAYVDELPGKTLLDGTLYTNERSRGVLLAADIVKVRVSSQRVLIGPGPVGQALGAVHPRDRVETRVPMLGTGRSMLVGPVRTALRWVSEGATCYAASAKLEALSLVPWHSWVCFLGVGLQNREADHAHLSDGRLRWI